MLVVVVVVNYSLMSNEGSKEGVVRRTSSLGGAMMYCEDENMNMGMGGGFEDPSNYYNYMNMSLTECLMQASMDQYNNNNNNTTSSGLAPLMQSPCGSEVFSSVELGSNNHNNISSEETPVINYSSISSSSSEPAGAHQEHDSPTNKHQDPLLIEEQDEPEEEEEESNKKVYVYDYYNYIYSVSTS